MGLADTYDLSAYGHLMAVRESERWGKPNHLFLVPGWETFLK
jgi:hypothetical protein